MDYKEVDKILDVYNEQYTGEEIRENLAKAGYAIISTKDVMKFIMLIAEAAIKGMGK